ncbi:Aldo/keto reductase [Calocera viscosa TUFC12733]|uniref:Aldo/keto reductase n=1 Tax=Calocera viscosa (strain TUFC12733) TaxID=1330018 RepID=A0A167HH44_CALVF|nr:Aldo/keto reductase [Calocera viscosa TUFC12733]
MAPRVPLIFGTMTMGEPGQNAVRTDNLEECQKILDAFYKHGGRELDTARVYAGGTTEKYLAQLNLRDSVLDTKCAPRWHPDGHKPNAVRESLLTSLKTLKKDKVRVFYLHAPDHNFPYEQTVEEVNKLYKEGHFEIFGLSNYAAWEVAEIWNICNERGWVKPRIYQGMYNAIARALEPELAPCLRKYNIRLVIYNPLAGGLLAGKILNLNEDLPAGRFKGESASAIMYRQRYLKDAYITAVKTIKTAADKHGFTMTEVALRWCQHHSVLIPTDGVIFGGTSVAQVEANSLDSEKGPLPADVIQALDEAWISIGHNSPTYLR